MNCHTFVHFTLLDKDELVWLNKNRNVVPQSNELGPLLLRLNINEINEMGQTLKFLNVSQSYKVLLLSDKQIKLFRI